MYDTLTLGKQLTWNQLFNGIKLHISRAVTHYVIAGRRRHCAVYYTCPQKFYNNVFVLVSLKTMGTFIEF